MARHWLAGNPDSDSAASRSVQPWIRSESRRKRIRLKRVCLFCPYLIRKFVKCFRFIQWYDE
jgi:hypothetical protein